MLTIAHIVNPVVVKETSDLFVAQPITFATMKTAQEFARNYDVDVRLYSAQYPEDHSVIPDYFSKTPDLDRSVLDVGTFKVPRKLPVLRDILDRLYEVSDVDYLIYTNVDIALMPHFYVSVKRIIELGYDAFVINRRTVNLCYEAIDDISLMYGELGESHPGYDCFVFKRDIYKKCDIGLACIGAKDIGKILLSNLYAQATQFKIFENKHLTFHLGDDRVWGSLDNYDYESHNRLELLRILNALEAEFGKFDRTEVPGIFLEKIARHVPPTASAKLVWSLKKSLKKLPILSAVVKMKKQVVKPQKSDF